MARLRDFKVDADKETKGVWCDVGEDLRLLIAGADNAEYRKYRDHLLQQVARHARSKQAAEKIEDITMRAMARHVLLGWENLDDDNGEPIPYSHEKALGVLRESRELYTIVAGYANDQALFRAEELEDAEKN